MNEKRNKTYTVRVDKELAIIVTNADKMGIENGELYLYKEGKVIGYFKEESFKYVIENGEPKIIESNVKDGFNFFGGVNV